MKKTIMKGFSFGLTTGIITTLGILVGMYSIAATKLYVVGAILTVTIADAFSDSLGIHISEEAVEESEKKVWMVTLSTFFFKLLFSIIFIIPVLFLELRNAVILCVFSGIILLSMLSYFIAIDNRASPLKVIFEHIFIAMFVVFITYYIGQFIPLLF